MFSLGAMWEKATIGKPEREVLPKSNHEHPGLSLLVSRKVRGKFLLFRTPNLWYFVMETHLRQHLLIENWITLEHNIWIGEYKNRRWQLKSWDWTLNEWIATIREDLRRRKSKWDKLRNNGQLLFWENWIQAHWNKESGNGAVEKKFQEERTYYRTITDSNGPLDLTVTRPLMILVNKHRILGLRWS